MFSKKKAKIEVERVSADIKTGLNNEQVETRKLAGLINKTKMIAGKTYWEIVRTDILSFFNILLFIIAGFIIFANVMDKSPSSHWYSGLFFTIVLALNIIIGLYQDLKAKHLMSKLKVITTKVCKVVRNNVEVEIQPSEIVVDDILVLSSGDQIPSDSILLEGNVFVNESMLTGESLNVSKQQGDVLYSGSYITSGTCYARVDKVGKENYIESLTEKAKAFKRNPSQILRSLKILFRYLGIIIITMAVIVFSVYGAIGKFSSVESFASSIRPIAGQFVGMIPAGLYLLTSFTLATGVLSLYRKKANVQDFYSIEMLARSDVICVDKTGTITDGNLSVTKVDNLSKLSDAEIGQIINSIVMATKDTNATAKALEEYFKDSQVLECDKALPFMSDNKYSGMSTPLGTTYLLGAIEFMNIKNKDALIKQSEQYTSKGYRLLALAKGNSPISEERYTQEVEALAFIVLQDHIKDDALETFKWFQDNGVQVKVISGDNALTVSEIARLAGINGAEKYISLEGKSLEEVKEIADQYVVFGRVTPEQKEALVMALRDAKHTVAMVGDGVNDMLALKRADCSIAMYSGSLSARNVSHVVLLDDNFSTMPSVVGEGRRVINNLQRTGSLFLTKTFFAAVLSFVFLIVSIATHGKYDYPLSTNNMILWEVFGIGLVSFFIALEPDSKPIKPGFLRNILKNAVPYAVLLLTAVLISYLLFVMNKAGLYTGVREFGYNPLDTAAGRYGATGVAILSFSILSMVVLYLTCRPLNLYRGIVVGAFVLIQLGIILGFAFAGGKNVLNIDFDKITGENWIAIAVIIISLGALAITINSIYLGLQNIKKKEKENEN